MYEEYLKTETEVIHDELEHTPDVNAVSTSSRCVCFDLLLELWTTGCDSGRRN